MRKRLRALPIWAKWTIGICLCPVLLVLFPIVVCTQLVAYIISGAWSMVTGEELL